MMNDDFTIETNDDDVLDINQCLCLRKAGLNTKTGPESILGRFASYVQIYPML